MLVCRQTWSICHKLIKKKINLRLRIINHVVQTINCSVSSRHLIGSHHDTNWTRTSQIERGVDGFVCVPFCILEPMSEKWFFIVDCCPLMFNWRKYKDTILLLIVLDLTEAISYCTMSTMSNNSVCVYNSWYFDHHLHKQIMWTWSSVRSDSLLREKYRS